MPSMDQLMTDSDEGNELIAPFVSLALSWRAIAPPAALRTRLHDVLGRVGAESPFGTFICALLERGEWAPRVLNRMDGDARLALIEVAASRETLTDNREAMFFVDASIVAASLSANGIVGRDRDTLSWKSYDLLLAASLAARPLSVFLVSAGLRCLLAVNDAGNPPEEGSDTARDHAAVEPIARALLNGHQPWVEVVWPLAISDTLLGSSVAQSTLKQLVQAAETLPMGSPYRRAAVEWRHWLLELSRG